MIKRLFYYTNRIMHSAVFFLSNTFKKRDYDVIFYYPAHFNRNSDGSNPFFQPFFDLCRKNNISYIAIEEPVLFSTYRTNKESIPFDFVFVFILLLRKIIPLDSFGSFSEREWYIAKLLKPFFFKKLSFNNYIVLSNSMLAFFRGLDKNASLYDYQHGIIHSLHPGYLKNGHPTEHIKINNVHLLLYGKGFLDVLLDHDKGGYYKNHAHVVGITDNAHEQERKELQKTNILFALQLLNGEDHFDIKQYDFLLDFFKENRSFFIENRVNIIFKEHPRYQNNIDMSELYDLPFAVKCEETLEDALEKCFINMTLFSTCIFDAAQKSIPTILWKNSFFPTMEVYKNDYNYPLGVDDKNEILKHIQNYLNDEQLYIQNSNMVFKWYKKFYSGFNSDEVTALLKKVEN